MARATSPLRDRMVFVVGARRSGTKWIQRMLATHPDVATVPGETGLFTHGLSQLEERFQHGVIGSPQTGKVFMDRDDLLDALREFCDSVFTGLLEGLGPNCRHLVERTPYHVHALGLIGDVYPDARVVHIIRDGRDVARSLVSQPWGPETVSEAAKEWRAAVTDGRRSGPGLAHYTEVRYEALLDETRGEIVRLFDWLELDLSESILAAAIEEGKALYDVDPSAPRIGSGKWAESFTPAQLKEFLDTAGSLLEELGYAEPGDPRQAPPAPPALRGPGSRPGVLSRSRQILRRTTGRMNRPSGASFEREVRRLLDDAMVVVERVLDLVATGRIAQLDEVFDPSVKIRIVDRHSAWEGRGAEAAERLLVALGNDPALRGRQMLGDVYPALPTFVVVTRYALTDGRRADRMLAITVANNRVTDMTYYRLGEDNEP